MNTGNVDTSGVWHAQDEEGNDLETQHRPESYSLRQNSKPHCSPDTHLDNHCCRLRNGWTTDEIWTAYFAVGWVETIAFIKPDTYVNCTVTDTRNSEQQQWNK
jgi:hypothetical protein